MTQKKPPICGECVRTRAVVQGTGGGGEGEVRRQTNQRINTFGDRIIGGSRFLHPPPPPNTKNYHQHSRGVRPQATGIPE